MAAPILCGVDSSAHARRAAEHAATLADRLGRRLVLVHAAGRPIVDPQTRRRPLGYDMFAAEHRRAHERWLAALAVDIGAGRAETRVEVGPAVDWLTALADAYSAALIIVGCRGVSTLHTVMLGSVSADLLRRSPCPVMVVPPRVHQDDARDRPARVVCGVGDRTDAPAARLAAQLADALDAPLTLSHVVPRATDPRLEHSARSLLSGVIADLAVHQRDVAVSLRHGRVSEELDTLAAEHDALLVVRSRGRGLLRSGLLGSVSRELATQGRRPVVICPRGARTHLAA